MAELKMMTDELFQSTLPIQGETFSVRTNLLLLSISIHSPYTGRDGSRIGGLYEIVISIHSPYTGRDSVRPLQRRYQQEISIHSPYTGRDVDDGEYMVIDSISIHSPYTGRDPLRLPESDMRRNFNPLSLYRERQERV